MRNPILWIIAGAAALFLAGRGLLSKNLQYRLDTIRLRGGVLQPIIEIALAIQNPTRQRAIVRSVVGEVYVEGNFVANISFFGETIIKPNAETVITIQARPSATGAFALLKDVLTREGSKKFVAKVKGSINVDGITVPLDISQTI